MSKKSTELWPTPKASRDGISPKTLQMVREGRAEASLDRVVLMKDHGKESVQPVFRQLILLQGDSLANLTVLPGSAKAQQMTETSGLNISELLKNSSQDMSLARTFLESSPPISTRCYLTWKTRATPARRLIFQLWPSMPRTDESVSSLWLTPSATNISKRGEEALERRKHYRNSINRKTVPPGNLAEQIQYGSPVTDMWPTPRTRGIIGGSGSREMLRTKVKKGELSEEEANQIAGTKLWPSPKASDAKGTGPIGSKSQKHDNQKRNLRGDVRLWPTPQAGSDSPAAHNSMSGDFKTRFAERANIEVTGQLNPGFVEWLMGFPIGYTDLEDSETP